MRSMTLMPDERHDDAAQAVDEKVVAQKARRADRAVLDAAQRERDERDDDERVEDDGAQDGALRRRQVHDVERVERGVGGRERGRE